MTATEILLIRKIVSIFAAMLIKHGVKKEDINFDINKQMEIENKRKDELLKDL